MLQKIKISVCEPGMPETGKYFSLRLQHRLRAECAEYPAQERLLIVSDIEGNFHAFKRLLLGNGVIDHKYRWTFGQGHLVIAGDCFDRGHQVTECLWLIYSLEEKARKQGGCVHYILGNHELMNLNGDWRYVHPCYALKKPSSSRNPPAALYGGNNELWQWLTTKNIIEKIGNLLIVHGGISGPVNQLKLSVEEINNLARPHYAAASKSFANPFINTLLNSDHSPAWYRGYYNGSSSIEQIEETLANYNVDTIITGHTLVSHVRAFFNNKVINVNTGHATGRSEALLIEQGRFYCVNINGRKKLLAEVTGQATETQAVQDSRT